MIIFVVEDLFKQSTYNHLWDPVNKLNWIGFIQMEKVPNEVVKKKGMVF